MKTNKSKKITIFEGKQIRRVWDEEKEFKKILDIEISENKE